jgi:6-phosphofructokinase
MWCGGICRYLALVAALTGEADFVFIPEWPPAADWPVKMCNMLRQARLFSVIVSRYQNFCWRAKMKYFAASRVFTL